MNIAFIAHDKKKDDIINFVINNLETIKKHNICATGTTGKLINEITGIDVKRYLSGPLGGDQQIGGEIASGNIDMVIFLRDPLTAQPHEPDVTALLRICDVHSIPLATNLGSAKILIQSFK